MNERLAKDYYSPEKPLLTTEISAHASELASVCLMSLPYINTTYFDGQFSQILPYHSQFVAIKTRLYNEFGQFDFDEENPEQLELNTTVGETTKLRGEFLRVHHKYRDKIEHCHSNSWSIESIKGSIVDLLNKEGNNINDILVLLIILIVFYRIQKNSRPTKPTKPLETPLEIGKIDPKTFYEKDLNYLRKKSYRVDHNFMMSSWYRLVYDMVREPGKEFDISKLSYLQNLSRDNSNNTIKPPKIFFQGYVDIINTILKSGKICLIEKDNTCYLRFDWN